MTVPDPLSTLFSLVEATGGGPAGRLTGLRARRRVVEFIEGVETGCAEEG